MDQFRFNEISPKKIKTKARKKFTLGVNKEIHRKTEDVARPMPQIKGSARGSLGLHLVLARLPMGTPIIPDIIVITPKTKATLFGSIAMGLAPDTSASSKNFGPHQANAPVQKVTQVNPKVENTKDLLVAKLFRSSV